MRSNYKRLGDFIQLVVGRNKDLENLPLVGLSITKKFIPSIANTIGTDMSTYRTIERKQFAYGPVTSRNGDKITIALFDDYDKALISQAYIPFEVKNTNELDPEYLMMCFADLNLIVMPDLKVTEVQEKYLIGVKCATFNYQSLLLKNNLKL